MNGEGHTAQREKNIGFYFSIFHSSKIKCHVGTCNYVVGKKIQEKLSSWYKTRTPN